MELKKKQEANLENKRLTYFLIGVVCALTITLVSFEYTMTQTQASDLEEIEEAEEMTEEMPITRQEEIKMTEQQREQVVEELEIVDDDEDVDEDLDIFDMEANDADTVGNYEVPDIEDEVEEEVDNTIYDFVSLQQKPSFPGGQDKLHGWLVENTKYPEQAVEAGLQGRVFVGFVIGKNGRVQNVTILRGVHPLLDEEAKRVVLSMPPWTPGMQRGKAVNVRYQVPINFKLTN